MLTYYLEMKIQYGFYLFIRKYLLTTCHNENTYLPLNIISFNSARQLHLRYIEETDRSNYFFILVLKTQFTVCFKNNIAP